MWSFDPYTFYVPQTTIAAKREPFEIAQWLQTLSTYSFDVVGGGIGVKLDPAAKLAALPGLPSVPVAHVGRGDDADEAAAEAGRRGVQD